MSATIKTSKKKPAEARNAEMPSDFPYKFWPDDYPVEEIFNSKYVAQLIEKFPSLKAESPDVEKVQKVLLKTCRIYIGHEIYRGTGATTERQLKKELNDLKKSSEKLYARLTNLSFVAFEALVASYKKPECNEPQYFSAKWFSEEAEDDEVTVDKFFDPSAMQTIWDTKNKLVSLLPHIADIIHNPADQAAQHAGFSHSSLSREPIQYFVATLAEHWELWTGSPVTYSPHNRSASEEMDEDGENNFNDFIRFSAAVLAAITSKYEIIEKRLSTKNKKPDLHKIVREAVKEYISQDNRKKGRISGKK